MLHGAVRIGTAADHLGQMGAANGHVAFIHTMQQLDAEDPWLHIEWAEVLIALGRGSEAGKHFQACHFAQHKCE